MAFNIKLDIKWLIIPVLIIVGFSIFSSYQHRNNKQLETYNRQLSGDLNSAERELQSADHELGVSKSKLVTQKELSDILEKENEEKDKKFDEFVKKHNLRIKSRDRSLAQLNHSTPRPSRTSPASGKASMLPNAMTRGWNKSVQSNSVFISGGLWYWKSESTIFALAPSISLYSPDSSL